MRRWSYAIVILLFIPIVSTGQPFVQAENLVLLSQTLRTYQKAACDDALVTLSCPPLTSISIQFAQYGHSAGTSLLCGGEPQVHPYISSPGSRTNNFTCYSQKALQSIVSRCQKRSECSFQVSPDTFGGDPCPYSVSKFVEVAYKCRPSQFTSVIGCEGDSVALSCSANSRIAIYSATFGRTEYESVLCPQPLYQEEETCLASFATEAVMNMCHGKRKCSIPAEASTFGRPCRPLSRMYLKVIHTCVPRKVLKKKYLDEVETDEEEVPEEDVEEESFDHHHHDASTPSTPTTDDDQGISSSSPFAVLHHSETDLIHQEEISVNLMHHNHSNGSKSNEGGGVRVIDFISQGMNAYSFIERNSQTFWVLIAISFLSVGLFLLFLLLIRLLCTRYKCKKDVEAEVKASSYSTIRRASGVDDDDALDLSLIMPPEDYYDVQLSTLQRQSTFASNKNRTKDKDSRVVCYSNSRHSMRELEEEEEGGGGPKSFRKTAGGSEVHFVFG